MTLTAPLFNSDGKKVGERELPEAVFGVEPNRTIMHQALVRQLANARQGTHNTLNRSQVDRTGRKMYKQKGTGNARHGDRTANLFVGGQIAHGPHPRSYRQSMPKQMRHLALRSALSAKAAGGDIVLVESFDLAAPRTRTMADWVTNACGDASTLIVLTGRNEAVERSIRNLPRVRFLKAGYLNVRDLLGYDRVVMPLDALEAVAAHLGAVPAAGEPEA